MRTRIGPIQLDAIRLALSGRDMAILRTLAAYRLATGSQLQRMHFTGHATDTAAARAARHAAARLAKLGLIRHLERRIGGVRSGSEGYIWHLAPVGRRILATTDDGLALARIAVTEPSQRTTDHTLAITEIGTRLTQAAHAGLLDLIEAAPEPASWRTYLSTGGGKLTLKPDLYAVTAAKGAEFEDLWFIEADLGTEHLPTIVRKAQQYQTYRNTGREQQAQGAFPKVIWIVPNETRAERITDTLAKAGRINADGHQAITLDQFIAHVADGLLVPTQQKGDHS